MIVYVSETNSSSFVDVCWKFGSAMV